MPRRRPQELDRTPECRRVLWLQGPRLDGRVLDSRRRGQPPGDLDTTDARYARPGYRRVARHPRLDTYRAVTGWGPLRFPRGSARGHATPGLEPVGQNVTFRCALGGAEFPESLE